VTSRQAWEIGLHCLSQAKGESQIEGKNFTGAAFIAQKALKHTKSSIARIGERAPK
jgi:hypothetical protein